MKTRFFILYFVALIGLAHAQSVAEALKFLAPTADQSAGDFKVENSLDGRGDRVTFWDTAKLGAQPNQAAIDQAKIDLNAQRLAAATAKQQESTLLDNARTKLANNQDLTAVELRAVLRALILRSAAVQSAMGTSKN